MAAVGGERHVAGDAEQVGSEATDWGLLGGAESAKEGFLDNVIQFRLEGGMLAEDPETKLGFEGEDLLLERGLGGKGNRLGGRRGAAGQTHA